MNGAKYFLDTNIFVYTFDLNSSAKAARAQDLVEGALVSGNGMISYQVAQEFVAVARRLFPTAMTFEQLEKYWEKTLRPLLFVQFSPALFLRAMELARREQITWYDALIVAAAIQSECKTLYSEDLQDGRRFGDLVVENPFRGLS
jgi:predicted nucleic acid-binding protein